MKPDDVMIILPFRLYISNTVNVGFIFQAYLTVIFEESSRIEIRWYEEEGGGGNIKSD